MITEDFAQFSFDPMPPEIQLEQQRVEWSEAIVFIFPIWWWSMPGMLKGWIDRVMAYGWAWLDPQDPHSGSLKERRILVLASAGDSKAGFAKRGYDKAFETQLTVGTWDYCGFRDVNNHIIHNITRDSTDAYRAACLDEVEALCLKTFPQE